MHKVLYIITDTVTDKPHTHSHARRQSSSIHATRTVYTNTMTSSNDRRTVYTNTVTNSNARQMVYKHKDGQYTNTKTDNIQTQ